MCGICGFLADFPVGQDGEARVRAMAAALSHRGPDYEGVETSGPMVLGHRRLSIIDLSPSGRQPMTNEDGTLFSVVNGEIYNFQELRRRLEEKGHRFRSGSDSEIIVHLYEEMGDDLLGQLRGMFAFALWDSKKRRLLIARDRLGKKPVYFSRSNIGFAFSSELASLRQGLPTQPEVDPRAIDAYLSLQYVPSPLSGFKGVGKLPAANYLVVEPGKDPVVRPYWKLSFAPRKDAPKTEDEALEGLNPLLEETVRLRKISDVPLGAFLSGGLDSSLVVALMAKDSTRPVETFSIDFAGASGEGHWARMVAKRWNTNHHEMLVKPDMVGILPELVRRYGEPYADTSAVPVYYLSKMTRENVVVALSGDGGDEVFAGYRRYMWDKLARHIRAFGPLSPVVAGALSLWPGAAGYAVRQFGKQLRKPLVDRYLPLIAHFSPDEKEDLLTPEFRQVLGRPVGSVDPASALFQTILDESDATDDIHRLLDIDSRSYLPDDILVKVDIASMAHALEVRAPFLDHVLVEWVAGLSSHLKLRGLRGKRLLRRAAKGLVPDEILTRKKKGFSLPTDEWFRTDLRDYARETLTSADARTRAYLKQDRVVGFLDAHDRGSNHGERLWNLVVLETWLRQLG